jgi:glutathione S-transferase
MNPPLLWHIPFSHFNEKVHWALDFKNIPHRRRVLGPNYLFKVWRATGRGTLPVFFLDGKPIGDSTAIIAALEQWQPEPALYPKDPAQRRHALDLEDYLDEGLGPSLRAALVTPLFQEDPDLALRVLTTGMPDAAYRNLRPVLRIFPACYRFRHKVKAACLEQNRAVVMDALERIARELRPSGYLVGDAFSVTDLTAAALLSPLLQPPGIQYPLTVALPDNLRPYRDEVTRHPAAQWATEIYRRHRGSSAEVGRTHAVASARAG